MAAPAEAERARRELHVVTGAHRERSIALVEADPSFEEAIPVGDRPLAGGVRVALLDLDAGDWEGPAGEALAGCGHVVVEGLLIRALRRYGRASLELYGPGDVVTDGEPEDREDGDVTWKVVKTASLARLDQRFELAAQRWPALWHVMTERASQRAERLAAHLAVMQLSRVDDRVEALLWQLAERFGKVTLDGVVVPIPLTHRVLGELAAARRSTVSVALGELARDGRVVRTHDGSWLLRRAPAPAES